MKYLIARVEEGTPLSGLRRLGEHTIIDLDRGDAPPLDVDEETEKAVAELAERERWDSDKFEVIRIPLEGAERLTINAKRGAAIGGRVGPL